MIDFTTKLLDLNGREILGLVVKDGAPVAEPATLGSVARDALANAQIALTVEEKLWAFRLASGVMLNSASATPMVESIALIKKCIAAAQTPIVVGRCFEILDPAGFDNPA